MPTAGVDFFRVDRSTTTKRLLIVSGVMVAVGATSIGAHLVHRIEAGVAHFISLTGGVVVLAGLVLGFGAMAMLLFENVYLVIREDGLLCHDNGKETAIAWADLERIRVEDEGFVVLVRREGDSLRWFAGSGAEDVRAKIDDARRKALHGILHVRNDSVPPRS